MTGPNVDNFQRALNRFKQSITPDLAKEFSISSLSDVKQVCKEIQQKHGSEGKLRYMGRLRGFIEAMEQFGKVIEIFVNASELVCFIWGPIKFILLTASTHISSFDKLLDAYAQIGDAIPGLECYSKTFAEHPPLATVLEDYYSDILEFHRISITIFKRPTWKDMYHSIWKTFDSKFGPILHSLCKRRELLESEKISAALYEIHRLRKDISSMYTENQQKMDEERLEKHRGRVSYIREKLDAPNYEIDQEMATENRLIDSSGEWVLENEEFQAWDNHILGHNILYINGIPGAGKTTLVSTVIRKLLDNRYSGTVSHCVAYFYFKYRQTGKDSHNSLLRGILDQLIAQDPAMSDHLFSKISAMDPTSLRLTRTLEGLVKEALESHQICYIVIDGLDESVPKEAERSVQWLLSLIKGRSENTTTSLRILLCGQRDGVLDKLLVDKPSITLENTAHTKDIERYCLHFCERIGDKFAISDEFQKSIAVRVTNSAKGMFLYARVVLENLLNQTKLFGLKRELQPGTFPEEIDKAYGRIAVRIFEESSPSEREDAKKILGWIVFAARPLRWREIQCSFCIIPDNGVVEYEDQRLRVTCKELCGSLVDVHPTNDARDNPECIVSIVHETAREYLIQKNLLNTRLEQARITYFLSKYLTSGPFKCGDDEKMVYNHAINGYYGLQDYAIQYWFYHARECAEVTGEIGPSTSQMAIRAVGALLKYYSSLLKLNEHDTAYDEEIIKIVKDLPDDENKRNTYFTIEQWTVQIRKTIETLRDDNLDSANQQILMNLYGSIVIYKCSKPWCDYFTTGFESIEERERHYDRHDRPFRCTFGECPGYALGFDTQQKLSQHVEAYHHETNDELEFPEVRPEKALTFEKAVECGDVAAVRKFLKHPGHIHRLESRYNPLHRAVQNGHLEVCKLLLESGFDVNITTKSSSGMTPLHVAVRKENIEIVHLFLTQEKCLPDKVDESGCSPFISACRVGNLPIVKLLFETGKMQVNRRASDGDHHPMSRITPLGHATEKGHFPVVRYLIQKAKVSPVTREILAIALSRGYESLIHKELLPAIATSPQENIQGDPYESGFPLDCVKLRTNWFVIFNQHSPRLFDVDLHHIPQITPPISAIFSGCGKYIASIHEEAVQLYDITTRKAYTLNSGPDSRDMSLQIFSPDSKWLVAATKEREVYIWDITSRQLRHKLNAEIGPIMSIHFTNDKRILASRFHADEIQVWDVDNHTIEITIDAGVWSRPSAVTISPDNNFLVAGFMQDEVRVWDIHTGHLVQCHYIDGNRDIVSNISFSPYDENVFRCTTETMFEVRTLKCQRLHNITPVVKGFSQKSYIFQSDSNDILFECIDGGVQLRDIKTRNSYLRLETINSHTYDMKITASLTGNVFATYGGKDLFIWSYYKHEAISN
ncbi:WD40 repeat-like protein [Daldinia decipiens]|uniref:WD40 repeat-like protein n=1 Tax=Daldinia decipiens TaxID=326647 RepID=UPI0020C259C1|nr:WD40 repeat-like protein [Daldinia decipiens]KAI1658130.1 WD40 repeat-like protein [Daldinia decipiens]